MRQAAEAEFRAFVHNRGPSLYQSAYLLTGTHDAATDLTHSALAGVAGQWTRLAGTDPDTRTRRIMYDRHLRGSRLRSWLGAVTARATSSPAGTGRPATATRLPLLAALAQLSARQRALVLLRHHENLPDHEVAALLDLPVQVVHRETDRALQVLRTLRPGPEELPGPEASLGVRLGRAEQVDPPEGLAAAALRRLRERRRIRTAATAGGLAVVVLFGTAAALRTQAVTPAHGVLAAVPGRYVVSSFCVLAPPTLSAQSFDSRCRVLDPRSGRYVAQSGSGPAGIGSRLASPDGTRTLVRRSDASYVVVDRDHLLDVDASLNPGFVPGPKMRPFSWSPDGRSVLFLDYRNTPEAFHRFRVLDAATGRPGDTAFLQGGPHPLALPPAWDPSGTSLWYPLLSNDGYRLTNFDLSGRLTGRTIAVPTETSANLLPVHTSPDGRYLLYAAWPVHVVDLRTGRLQQWGPPEPSDRRVRDLEIIGWYDDNHLLGVRMDAGHSVLAVIDFDGRVVRELVTPVFPGRKVDPVVTSAAAYPPGIGLRF